MGKESRYLTASIISWGPYQWVRIPAFGLMMRPQISNDLWNTAWATSGTKSRCHAYLDDVILFSSTSDEHFGHLRSVFCRLREHGVKLKPRKCKFFKRRVCFLGRVVSKDGYTMDSKSVEAVKFLKKSNLTTIRDVKTLGNNI